MQWLVAAPFSTTVLRLCVLPNAIRQSLAGAIMPLDIQLHEHASDAPALARMAFGCSPPDSIGHPDLPLLNDTPLVVAWQATGDIGRGHSGPVEWHHDDHCLMGHARVPLHDDMAQTTARLYTAMLSFVARSRFRHLIRMWNFLPQINIGDGDREQYRQFCVGRAHGFDQYPCPPGQLPAGTAIGSPSGRTLHVYFLASDTPPTQIENPRQISAFDYPRRYGPRQPQFSRAVIWQDSRLIVSGTASITGHATRHRDDLEGQLAETRLNLAALQNAGGAGRPILLRVYIRHSADYPAVRAFIEHHYGRHVFAVYLHADICRADLLVEIEGIFDIPG